MNEENSRPGTWQRIRQRKLVQWALAYLAGAWLVLQLVELRAAQRQMVNVVAPAPLHHLR